MTSVKGVVLEEVQSFGLLERFVGGHPMAGTAHSGWTAGNPRLFVGAPWVVSVDDHVDPDVWTMVMNLALDCGAVVVPARSDEHDAAAATISHLPHLLAEALAVTAGEVPLAFGSPPAHSATAPGWRPPRRIWCAPCARPTPTSCCPSSSAPLPCSATRATRWPRKSPLTDLVEAGHAARIRYDSFSRPEIVTVVIGAGQLAPGARRRGSRGWGDQIRSANPG